MKEYLVLIAPFNFIFQYTPCLSISIWNFELEPNTEGLTTTTTPTQPNTHVIGDPLKTPPCRLRTATQKKPNLHQPSLTTTQTNTTLISSPSILQDLLSNKDPWIASFINSKAQIGCPSACTSPLWTLMLPSLILLIPSRDSTIGFRCFKS